MKTSIHRKGEKIKTLVSEAGQWFFTAISLDEKLGTAFLYYKKDCIGSVAFDSLPKEDKKALSKLLDADWAQSREPFENW